MFFSLFVYSEIAKVLLILQSVIIVLPFARFVDVNAPVSRDSVNFTKQTGLCLLSSSQELCQNKRCHLSISTLAYQDLFFHFKAIKLFFFFSVCVGHKMYRQIEQEEIKHNGICLFTLTPSFFVCLFISKRLTNNFSCF